jgi:hypothetical protein
MKQEKSLSMSAARLDAVMVLLHQAGVKDYPGITIGKQGSNIQRCGQIHQHHRRRTSAAGPSHPGGEGEHL